MGVKGKKKRPILCQLSCLVNSKITDDRVNKDTIQYILIPVIAKRVCVQEPKQSKLNFFQETILKLLDHKLYSQSELCELLLLEDAAVRNILADLKEEGYLDSGGKLTKKGNSALSNELIWDDKNTKTGLILYDELNGEYFDNIFLPDDELNVIEYETHSNKANINLGKDGNTVKRDALFIFPNEESKDIPEPSPKDLQNILGKYKKSLKMTAPTEFKANIPKDLTSTHILNERPIPYFLVSFIYLETDLNRKQYWQIYDPIHSFANAKIRGAINQIDDNEALQNWIKNSIYGAKSGDDLAKEENRQTGVKRAEQSIQAILGPNINIYADVFKSLTNSHVNLENIRKMHKLKKYQKIVEELPAFVNNFYKALELSLYHTYKKYEYALDIGSIPKDQSALKESLTEFATKLKLLSESSRFRQSAFARVKRGSIVYIEDNEKESIVLSAANLLLAKKSSEHPFYKKESEGFLDTVFELFNMRNSIQHATTDSDFEMTDSILNSYKKFYVKALGCISILLSLEWNRDSTRKELDEIFDLAENVIVYNEIKTYFGIKILEDKTLSGYLMAIQAQEANKSKEMVRSLYNVLEYIFDMMLEKQFNKKAFSLVGYAIDFKKMEEYLTGVGFSFDVSQLPEGFLKFKIQKLKKAFVSGNLNTVLNAKLLLLVYSDMLNNNMFLQKIARTGYESADVLELFMIAPLVSDLRGHSSLPNVDMSELVTYKNIIFEIVRSIYRYLHF